MTCFAGSARLVRVLLPVLLAGTVSVPAPATAQISPGDLSAAHRDLDGMGNCTRCHETGQRVSSTKCMACHGVIRKDREAGAGFHGASATGECVSCHKEHLGRDAAITRFDTQGFDHARTGFTLTGDHSALGCTRCHTPGHITDEEVLKSLSERPRMTYLGLEGRCVACHADRHAGTVGADCSTCHGTVDWSPATGFDHARTAFTLTGRHASVECADCHPGMAPEQTTAPVRFDARPAADCTPCHASPHGTSFSGRACRTCHSTSGWKTVAGFDHAATRFPLLGRHVSVACEKCHPGMRAGAQGAGGATSYATRPFADCTPCHTTPHGAGFSGRACATCHAPGGWAAVPAGRFDHGLSGYPLEGRHLGLTCEKCHKAPSEAGYAVRFDLPHERCMDCHSDAHEGQFSGPSPRDCADCHTVQGFTPSTFGVREHTTARLPLQGAHRAVPCRVCHKREGEGGLRFRFTIVRCEICHEDQHGGQFATAGQTACDSCHGTGEWRAIRFDHDRQTAFPLDGAHRRVPCAGCHRTERIAGEARVRYRPLSTTCESCHQEAR